MALRWIASTITRYVLAIAFAAALVMVGDPQRANAACTSSVGPGIAPPSSLPSGVPGFHAYWYGQSGYMQLCPGDSATATVAYYNSGSAGWVAGRMGEMAYLGTSNPEPGQDRASVLGGDGTAGSPATGWPRYNRVAAQPAPYVGPGQVAWFQFRVRAPNQPGTYRLALRPLIEGAQWMEDYGVFWYVTVLDAATGAPPPTPSPTPAQRQFGDGMYAIGRDLSVGTYRTRSGASGCYWERLRGASGAFGEIIANEVTSAPTIVTIASSDAYFRTQRCGTWTSNLSAITTSPTGPFSDGAYIVGTDVAAGTWRATGGTSASSCYWERLSGFSGTFQDIIANDLSQGPTFVTISASDRGFKTRGCGTWTKTG
jgi:hypothetical protein